MSTDGGYHYTSLTAAISDKASPLRRHFEQVFPNLRPLQTEYRAGGGPLLVDGGDANPGTVGAAFDYLARFTLDPGHLPQVAFLAFLGSRTATVAVREVVLVAEQTSAEARTAEAPETLLRACWALALCTEVYRVGLMPGSALARLGHNGFTGSALLGLAPDPGLRQLQALHQVARDRLYPALSADATRALGPTFDGSTLCAADADLIVDGCLLDIKTHLGSKSAKGRVDGLSLLDLYQLLGYVLFDRSDTYRLSAVGLYSARYGHLARWSLPTFLATLAGRPVDLASEREAVWSLLGG